MVPYRKPIRRNFSARTPVLILLPIAAERPGMAAIADTLAGHVES
jgi:hypothetical protein